RGDPDETKLSFSHRSPLRIGRTQASGEIGRATLTKAHPERRCWSSTTLSPRGSRSSPTKCQVWIVLSTGRLFNRSNGLRDSPCGVDGLALLTSKMIGRIAACQPAHQHGTLDGRSSATS